MGRGYHPDLILMDEVDFSKEALLTVVLPLLCERDVVLFALSSPNIHGGVFTSLVFAKDKDGNPLSNSMVLGDPCDMCRSTPHPEQCNHKADTIASWKDKERMELVQKLYSSIGREDVYRAELGNMGTLKNDTVFKRETYSGMISSEPIVTSEMINAVFVGVDPAYGGKCHMAVTAIGLSAYGRGGFHVRTIKKPVLLFFLLFFIYFFIMCL